MLSVFSCAFWPSVCLLWRNAYLDLPPIFWLSWFFKNFILFIYFLYSRFLLVIYFIHISVYMSIPISQFIPPPPPRHPVFPPWCPYVCSLHLCLYFCLAENWVFCFFHIELHELFVYFGDLSLVGCFFCKYFLLFYGSSFHFVYGKNKFSIHEIVKKEKEIRASFDVTPQAAKITSTVCNKCLVKMEKALNLYNQIFWERDRSHSHHFYYSILL